MTTITALPTPPSRDDPANFSTRADAFHAALPTFATQVNTVAGEVNTNATTATTQAGIATAKATIATDAAASAIAASGATQWASGTTYADGAVVWSPVNHQTYRRAIAGAGTTDPSIDATNWVHVSLLPDQTGNAGKFVKTDGTTASWAEVKGLVPINALVAFDSSQTGNTVTGSDGAEFLKTGVTVSADAYPLAESAPYLTASHITLSSQDTWMEFAGLSAQPNYSAYESTCAATNGTITVVIGTTNGASGGNDYATSTDGLTWTPGKFPAIDVNTLHYAIAYGGGLFVVACSSRDYCYTSPDGLTWTKRTLPANTSWRGVGCKAGLFVLAATATTTCAYSTDGVTWYSSTNSRTWTGTNGAVFCSIGGTMVLHDTSGTGGVSTTTDGIAFTTRTVSAFSSVACGMATNGSTLVYRGNDTSNGVRSSTDGITWTNRSVLTSAHGYIGYVNGKFISQNSTGTSVFTSTDGISWTEQTDTVYPGATLFQLIKAGNYYFGVNSSATRIVSLDGVSWGVATVSVLTPQQAVNGHLGTVWGSSGAAGAGVVFYSPDGTNIWQLQNKSLYGFVGSSAHSGIAYGNGKYWANCVNAPYCLYSTDLITWTGTTTNASYGVTDSFLDYANGILYGFSVSASTSVYFTTNGGTSWTSQSGLTSAGYRGVTYGNGVYVLYSNISNAHYYSTNGTSFSLIPAGQLPIDVGDVVHDGTRFLAFGTGATVVYESTNGSTWTLLSLKHGGVFGGSVYGAAVLDGALYGFGTSSYSMAVVGGDRYIRTTTSSMMSGAVNNGAVHGNTYLSLNGTYLYRASAAGNYVLNDTNLKTYNATDSSQTNFYKRVA